MSDESSKKNKLLQLFSECESQAPHVEALGRDIAQSARFYRDIAGPSRDVFTQVPEEALSPDQWDRQIEACRSFQSFASGVLASRTMVNTFVAATQSTANTAVSGVVALLYEPPPSSPSQDAIESAKTRLRITLERYPLADQIRSSMRRLGLDSRAGGRNTALALLNEAQGALDRPVYADTGSVSVLIALRECINTAIAELLRRRPRQEPARNFRDKVTSIGRQCAISGLRAIPFNVRS